MSTVAVLGLGAMGLRMAKKLLETGHDVVVYNRTGARARTLEAEGATRADSPREAAARSEFVIGMVTDDGASRAVWLDANTGAIGGLREGAVAIESSTLTPAWVRELADAVAARGAGFLDAPVVGSRPQAEAGQLIYCVGGATETLAKAREVLSAMGAAIHHLGPVGAGIAVKLAVNAFFGIQVAAMGEILGLLRKSGIDVKLAVEVLGTLSTTSPALKAVAGQVAARSYAPLFPINLVEKDFRYITESAAQINAPVPASKAVRDVYARALRAGYGDDNISGIAQLFD